MNAQSTKYSHLSSCTPTESRESQLRDCQRQLDQMLEMLKHLRLHAPLLFAQSVKEFPRVELMSADTDSKHLERDRFAM